MPTTTDWHNLPQRQTHRLNALIDEKTYGATSVADGGTITHGLGTTPSSVQCTATTTNEFVAVTAVGATTFTVSIKKDTGAAGTTAVVYWVAYV